MVLTNGGHGKGRRSLRLRAAMVVSPPSGVATSTARVGLQCIDVGGEEDEETRQHQGPAAGSRTRSISISIKIGIDQRSCV